MPSSIVPLGALGAAGAAAYHALWSLAPTAVPPAFPSFVQAFQSAARNENATPNLHQSGWQTIAWGLHATGNGGFPFKRPPFSPARFAFVNFGRAGFFAGEADGGKFAWAEIIGTHVPRAALETAPFVKASALPDPQSFQMFKTAASARFAHALVGTPAEMETGLLMAWTGGLQCLAALKGLTTPRTGFQCDPFSEHETRAAAQHCVALGSRREGALEVMRVGPNESTACYLSRSLADVRFPLGAYESKIVCVDPAQKSVLFPALGDAKFVLPSADPGVSFVYEGVYTPPKLSRLDIRTGKATDVLPAAGTQPLPQVPEGFESLYVCDSPAASPPRREWYAVDTDLFEGVREAEPENDRAFRIATERTGLTIESLDWDKVIARAPGLGPGVRFGCVFEDAIDARCAVRVLRQTAQMAAEREAGAWNEAVEAAAQWNALGVAVSALTEVDGRMRAFELAAETRVLLRYFTKALESLKARGEAQGGFPSGQAWWKELPGSNARRASHALNAANRESPAAKEMHARFLASVGLPVALWTQLEKESAR